MDKLVKARLARYKPAKTHRRSTGNTSAYTPTAKPHSSASPPCPRASSNRPSASNNSVSSKTASTSTSNPPASTPSASTPKKTSTASKPSSATHSSFVFSALAFNNYFSLSPASTPSFTSKSTTFIPFLPRSTSNWIFPSATSSSFLQASESFIPSSNS